MDRDSSTSIYKHRDASFDFIRIASQFVAGYTAAIDRPISDVAKAACNSPNEAVKTFARAVWNLDSSWNPSIMRKGGTGSALGDPPLGDVKGPPRYLIKDACRVLNEFLTNLIFLGQKDNSSVILTRLKRQKAKKSRLA